MTVDFVAVTDPGKRRALGEIYRDGYRRFQDSPGYPRKQRIVDPVLSARRDRMSSSAEYLGEHMGDSPAIVLCCSRGPHREAALARSSSVMPSIWSFMLAARARGLGTAWTNLHALREYDIAELLGIPYSQVAQVVMTPVACTLGTDFKPAPRPKVEDVLHWNGW